MNSILQISNRLEQKDHGPGGGPRNIHANECVEIEHLDLLVRQLTSILTWWQNEDLLPGAIVDVEYRTVVPKSNRVKTLLAGNGKKANDSVVGARFTDGGEKHVITHYLDNLSVLESTIEKLKNAKLLLESDDRFDDKVTYDQISKMDDSLKYDDYDHSKSSFINTIVDAYHVENFRIPQRTVDTTQNSIVTIYDTGVDIVGLMQKMGIVVIPGSNLVHKSTLLLSKNDIDILNERAPFLIAMSVEEESTIDADISLENVENDNTITIEPPSNEPVIGVIDKAFSDQVYFKDWVEYHDMLDENLPRSSDDAIHGTAVSSIIVDGPTFNPDLDDGCGKFKVRHFGVATGNSFSSFTVMKLIRDIVQQNRDIKVWNLSLGSDKEIGSNSISPEAAMLDELQYEYDDIIFVVAGTNKSSGDGKNEKIIGAPADSINSVVVNSVDASGSSASYSRKGIVLSFFNKPDICTYGGDGQDYIRVCTPAGEGRKIGTSFAAPWVTRKLAYLTHVLGLPREVAKALIIDAAAKWDTTTTENTKAPYIGHGVVPHHINDIVKTPDDEIRFIISGTSKKWDTYNYNLPVPVENGHHPFVARATLCYFPKCSINQGVDYTNTELDIYFGRVAEGKLSKYVKAINGNVQQVLSGERFTVNEKDARALYRKWDNTKRVQDKYTSRTRSKVALEKGLWGISVKTNDRLNNNDGKDIKFGVVATLKEISGKNRIDTFIQQCQLRGWLVEPLNVETQVDIYAAAQEPIEFE